MHQLKGVMKTPFFLPPLAIAGQQNRNAWWLGHKVFKSPNRARLSTHKEKGAPKRPFFICSGEKTR